MENTVSDQELAALNAIKDRIQQIELVLTPAEILDLNTTPKLIIPSQGAGKVIEFVSAVMSLDFETTQYATQGDLSFETETTGTTLSDTVAGAALLLAAADAVRVAQALSADVQLDPGEGLVLTVATADPTAGDSPLRVKVNYRVHDTGLA